MIGLLQRVTGDSVAVNGEIVGSITKGLLILVGVKPGDAEADAQRLLSCLLKYRIFDDEACKMNVSLQQIGGGFLLVPQFTLAADTRSGLRPGFSTRRQHHPEVGRCCSTTQEAKYQKF